MYLTGTVSISAINGLTYIVRSLTKVVRGRPDFVLLYYHTSKGAKPL